ncbi:hypothetical protein BH10CYA1_BH10CYA1_09690 [soil metagenome]
MQLPTFKLTYKVALLIVVPLAGALLFVFLLNTNLTQAEQDIEAEARAQEVLVLVNQAIRDAMDACGGMLIIRMYHEPKALHDTTNAIQRLTQDRDKLLTFAENNPIDAADIKDFVLRIDQGNSMFKTVLDTTDDSESISELKVMGQMKNYSLTLNFEGNKLAEKKADEGRMFRQKRKEDRQHIELLIQVFMGVGFMTALVLGFSLITTVFKRLEILMRNTINIGIGKPLEQPLEGKDELALLDGVIHQLSDDLAILRTNERALIDNAAEIICSLDRALRITQINPAVERILGYTSDELLGTAIQSIVQVEDKTEVYEKLKGLSSISPQAAFEARILSKTGRFVEMHWIARWSLFDKTIFCVAHDITERKEAERLKQELFAMVSHDLRSPLTSVSMTLEMLDDGILGTLNERGLKLAGSANESVKSLMILINDLLESERMEHGGMILDLAETDLVSLMHKSIDFVTAEASSKNIRLEAEGSCSLVQIDSEKIRRVLINLINNAIKFSDKDSTITVSVQDLASTSNNEIEMRVTDHGPGIPFDKQSLVFEKFKQAGRRDEGEKKGSGLGLAICKAIIEAHGGTIGVISNQSTKGSIFWFRVPIITKPLSIGPP